jgi:hypothetical protein
MSEILVQYGYCAEHLDRHHMVDERGRHVANGPDEMKAHGYFYLRHIGSGWFRYRTPSPNWIPSEPEPPEHDIHVIEPDF